jgi:Protein of unknown function (DUF2568)
MKVANDGLRFLLELCSLAALAYWGSQAVSGPGRWALAVILPVVAATVWARWIAAKSVTAARDPWRLALEVAVFGGSAVALATTGQTILAVILAAAAAVHLALTFVLDQRRTARTEHVVATGVPSLSKEP